MKKHITKRQTSIKKSKSLEKLNYKAVGIDVGANSIFVCAGLVDGTQMIREFSTFTDDLNAMAEWLKILGCDGIAMESTGVFWIPVYDILSAAGFNVSLVDARVLNAVPGRNKTDVTDCQWIQQLHAYGLLKGAFRPDDQSVTFRGYVRQQARLTEAASTQTQLMHKALTQMNIQLRQVLRNITGLTGLQIIRAIVKGERDAHMLAQYRDPRCKHKQEDIVNALTANYRDELIFSLKQALEGYDFFQQQIAHCETKITPFLATWKTKKNDTKVQENTDENVFEETIDPKINSPQTVTNLQKIFGVNLTNIPGIGINSAVRLLAEIGNNISNFPTVKHFTAWIGVCPNNKISGSKILSSKTKPTANRVAQILRMAVNTLFRSKTALGEFLRRMKVRIGAPAAITATAHKLAKIIFKMLTEKKEFKEAGENAYQRRYEERMLINIKRKAAAMGYDIVKVEPKVA